MKLTHFFIPFLIAYLYTPFAIVCRDKAPMNQPPAQTSEATHKNYHTLPSSYFAHKSEYDAEKRPWTIVIYMAADNDLFPFAIRNIEQMKQVGSNENVHIVVHFDFHQKGQEKKTKRIYIEKNKAVQIGPDHCMDSGDPETLIDAACWAIDHFPSDHLCLILWNHGSGDLNPFVSRSINPTYLFFYNEQTQKIELDRSIPFSDFVYAVTGESQKRGVCFDESTGNYLNDQKLKLAFERIYRHRQQNIDLVLFDACLMAGTGTAWLMHHYVDYMGASQEVVLGPGYNYYITLSKLASDLLTPYNFLLHVISAYKHTYSRITNDFTHSGFNLTEFHKLDRCIDALARHIEYGLQNEKQHSTHRALRNSSTPRNCTHFDEPTYIDLDHFLTNLLQNSAHIELHNNTQQYIQKLQELIYECQAALHYFVIYNVAGPHFRHAHGISIDYPQTMLRASYAKTEFARNNAWASMLRSYLT